MRPSIYRFSVITVALNSKKTIEQTLQSVLNQSYTNFEYIIIDGGSTDGTLEILHLYSELFRQKGITYCYVSGPDLGIYDAMNKGIELAKGEWIGIINSDDFYSHRTLENVDLEVRMHPKVEVVFGNINIVDRDSRIIRELIPDRNLKSIVNTFSIFHPSMFINKRLYDDFGLYDLKYVLSSDWDLSKRLFLCGCRFHYLNFTMSNFRKGGAGSGFRRLHLYERLLIRHKSFKLDALKFDIKDILLFFYFKLFPGKSEF